MAGESDRIREHQENRAFSDALQAKGRSLLRMIQIPHRKWGERMKMSS